MKIKKLFYKYREHEMIVIESTIRLSKTELLMRLEADLKSIWREDE